MAQPVTLSSQIVYDDPTWTRNKYWENFPECVQNLNRYIRDTFILPLTNGATSANKADQRLAAEYSDLHTADPKMQRVHKYFSHRDLDVQIVTGQTSRIFTIRLFESDDKNIQFVYFSFYGNRECDVNGEDRDWDPQDISELGRAPIEVLKALGENGFKADSLLTSSLGNLAWDNLTTIGDLDVLPKTLVSNRGYTSTEKVIRKLYPCLSGVLHKITQLFGWDANPERGLLRFLSYADILDKPRMIAILECDHDHYFSEKGAFDPGLVTKIGDLGHSCFRASFFPPFLHERAHHAVPINKLKFNAETSMETVRLDQFFEHCEGDNVARLFVRDVVLKGNTHNCFVVGGSDAPLQMSARDLFPIFQAFINY